MTTAIKFRALPTGMTLTVDVTPMGAGSVLETVTCMESGGVYSGDISAELAGQFLFVLKNSGTVIGSRVGTIFARIFDRARRVNYLSGNDPERAQAMARNL